MVTLPAGPGGSPDVAHRHRELAESFGADAGRYDRARPRYPADMVDAIVARVPGRSLLDVGTGTGISAEPFRDRGFTVLGVEPDARMAALARAKGLPVEDGGFEQWDPAGRTFDGVVAGQSWHWVDPDRGAAKAAVVLRPGGCLALFWSVGRPPSELAIEFAEIVDSIGSGLPFNPWRSAPDARPYGAIIDAAAAGLQATGVFGPTDRQTFSSAVTLPGPVWLEQVSTSGGINRLPPEQLGALTGGMGRAIERAGGYVAVEYTTVVAMAERLTDGR